MNIVKLIFIVLSIALTTNIWALQISTLSAKNPTQTIKLENGEWVRSLSKNSQYIQSAKSVGYLKLKVEFSDGLASIFQCTASLIDDDKIITNYHCLKGLDNVNAVEAKLEMNYLNSNQKSTPLYFNVNISPLESNRELDFVVLKVSGQPKQRFNKLSVFAKKLVPGNELYIIQHPKGNPKIITKVNCKLNVVRKKDFIHTCPTSNGSSGSPIFDKQTQKIIGIHYASSNFGYLGKAIEKIVKESSIINSIAVKSVIKPPSPKKVINKIKPPKSSISESAKQPINAKPKVQKPEFKPKSKIVNLPPPIALKINSNIKQSLVFMKGIFLGLTPLEIIISQNDLNKIRVRKAGYQDFYINTGKQKKSKNNTIVIQASLKKSRLPVPEELKDDNVIKMNNPVAASFIEEYKNWRKNLLEDFKKFKQKNASTSSKTKQDFEKFKQQFN